MKKRPSRKVKETLNLQNLLKANPEVALAKKLMEQARKTEKAATNITQNNYYKIPQA